MTTRVVSSGALIGVFTGLAAAKPESLRDTPIAINAIGSESLADMGVTTVESVVNLAPNLSLSNGTAGGGATINLRGLGATRTLVLTDGKRTLGSNLVGSGGIGFSEDPSNSGASSRWFTDIEVLTGAHFGTGRTQGAFAVGGRLTYYDGEVDTEDGDEFNWDINVAFTGRREFSESVALSSLVRAHYGDHGSLTSGYLRPGLQYNEVLDWQTKTNLHWRIDGLSLGSEGWGFTTYYHTRGFLESGSDERDSLTLGIGQEVRYNPTENTSVYGGIEYSQRSWDRWDAYDLDLTTGSIGVRNETADAHYDISLGWQWRDYSDIDEEEDNFYFDLHYDRALTPDLSLKLKANYGVQQVFANEGGSGSVDPVGTLLGARLERVFDEDRALGVHFLMLDVESEFGGDDVHRGLLGVDGKIRLNDSIILQPSISWVNNEDSPTDEGSYFNFRLGGSFPY